MHYLSLVSEEDFSNSRVYLKLNSQWSLCYITVLTFLSFFIDERPPTDEVTGDSTLVLFIGIPVFAGVLSVVMVLICIRCYRYHQKVSLVTISYFLLIPKEQYDFRSVCEKVQMMQIRIRKKERETRYIQIPWTITLSFVAWNIYCLTFSIPDRAEERFRVCSGFEAAVKNAEEVG